MNGSNKSASAYINSTCSHFISYNLKDQLKLKKLKTIELIQNKAHKLGKEILDIKFILKSTNLRQQFHWLGYLHGKERKGFVVK